MEFTQTSGPIHRKLARKEGGAKGRGERKEARRGGGGGGQGGAACSGCDGQRECHGPSLNDGASQQLLLFCHPTLFAPPPALSVNARSRPSARPGAAPNRLTILPRSSCGLLSSFVGGVGQKKQDATLGPCGVGSQSATRRQQPKEEKGKEERESGARKVGQRGTRGEARQKKKEPLASATHDGRCTFIGLVFVRKASIGETLKRLAEDGGAAENRLEPRGRYPTSTTSTSTASSRISTSSSSQSTARAPKDGAILNEFRICPIWINCGHCGFRGVRG
jgi:hypothetical protein